MFPYAKTIYCAITSCLITPFRSSPSITSALLRPLGSSSSFSIPRRRVKSTYSTATANTATATTNTNTFATRSTFLLFPAINSVSTSTTAFLPGVVHRTTRTSSFSTRRNMSQTHNAASTSTPDELNRHHPDEVPGDDKDKDEKFHIAANLASVQSQILQTVQECNRSPESVRLVAVSKTKPIEMLMEAYNAGQRHFGENYAQELMQKAAEMPSDIQWHFIGPLQSNKAGPLVKSLGLKKLVCVETVSSMKLAQKLDHAAQAWIAQQEEQEEENDETTGGGDSLLSGSDHHRHGDEISSAGKKLGIYIQVNTSGEDTKSGVSNQQECVDLVKEIVAHCPHLRIDGLMTIGAPGDFSCFDVLVECRKSVAEALSVDVESLELSMGMSGDFVEAIQRGATSVRVGSTIFGARDYSKKGK